MGERPGPEDLPAELARRDIDLPPERGRRGAAARRARSRGSLPMVWGGSVLLILGVLVLALELAYACTWTAIGVLDEPRSTTTAAQRARERDDGATPIVVTIVGAAVAVSGFALVRRGRDR